MIYAIPQHKETDIEQSRKGLNREENPPIAPDVLGAFVDIKAGGFNGRTVYDIIVLKFHTLSINDSLWQRNLSIHHEFFELCT